MVVLLGKSKLQYRDSRRIMVLDLTVDIFTVLFKAGVRSVDEVKRNEPQGTGHHQAFPER